MKSGRRRSKSATCSSLSMSQSVDISVNKFDILVMCSPSYWLSLINQSEAAAKHQDSLRFFKLAFQACCEDVQLLRDELKSYVSRHNLLDNDHLGVGVRYNRPEPPPANADLPFEIQIEILKRLPIKPLIRFRSVSKPWKNLIGSSKFINDFNHTRSQKLHLLVKYNDAYKLLKFVSIFVYDDTFPQLKFSLTAPEIAKMSSSTEIVGCSQGLMCLYSYYNENTRAYRLKNVVLWNPSIRKSVVIDVPYSLDSSFAAIGFGVSPHTNDPKIVKINYFNDHSQYDSISCLPWQVEVFSLSSGVWRSPLSSNLHCRSLAFTQPQVVIDGFIYLLAEECWVHYHQIMSFDMKTEEFTEIYLPDSLKKCGLDNFLSISKLNETLVVLESIYDSNYEHNIEFGLVCNVWIMEHGFPKLFTKLYTVNTPAAPIRNVLGFTNSGKLIMVMGKGSYNDPVFAYEPCSKHITDIGIAGHPREFFASSFVETLLLLAHQD